MSTETLATSSVADLIGRIEHLYVSTRSVIEGIPADRWDERLPFPVGVLATVAVHARFYAF